MSRFRQLFESAGNDYDALLGRTDGDTELINELMRMFVDDMSARQLCAALEAGDAATAFRAAHSLKGSSGMLGMTALHKNVCELTEALRRGDIASAKALYPASCKEYDAVISIIKDSIC